MYKRFFSILLCLMLALSSVPAFAAMKAGKHVQLVVCGLPVELNAGTGYISKNGSKTYIPIAAVAEALGYEIAFNAKKTGIAITTADGDVIKAVSGYRMISINDTKVNLGHKAVRQNGVLLVDPAILEYLDADVALYPLDAQLKKLGYSGPAMIVHYDGQSTLPPALTENSFAIHLEAAKTADQIVAVQYSPDGAAMLTYHEKIGGVWKQQLSCEAIVGKNGIGKSVEGDKKTPRGTYDLTSAFGIKANPGTALPYTQVTKNHYWCCDVRSPYYNRLVDISNVRYAPSAADEHLSAIKGYYNYAIALNYNPDCVPGKGSAIFLHCTGSKTTTDGCIAIPEEILLTLLQTLKPGAKIVIF